MTKKNTMIDPKKLALFLGLTTALRTGAVSQSGQWLVAPCPKKWAEAKDEVDAVKAAGFKTCWAKGNRIGVNVKDVAKAA